MENVLFKNKETLHIKIVDFGIAGVCKANQQDKVEAGSLAYMPPEVLAEANAETTPKIDVWAIGCILYGMMYGKLPFWGDTEEEFAQAIMKQKLKFDPSVPITDGCKKVITQMLDKDPKTRANLLDLMETKFWTMDESVLKTKVDELVAQWENKLKLGEPEEEEKKDSDSDYDIPEVGLEKKASTTGAKKKAKKSKKKVSKDLPAKSTKSTK